MPKPTNPKPPYPPQFRQQMVELVGTGRRPSELAKHKLEPHSDVVSL